MVIISIIISGVMVLFMAIGIFCFVNFYIEELRNHKLRYLFLAIFVISCFFQILGIIAVSVYANEIDFLNKPQKEKYQIVEGPFYKKI